MKYINVKYLLFILILALTACDEDFLERYPLDSISPESYWLTTDDLRLYVNQFYTSAFPVSGSDRYEHQFADDISSDDVVFVQANPRLRGSRTVPQSGGWDYGVIRSLNVFFANYEKCEGPFEEYKRYLGEAHFFRALFYFNLVRAYGDVPYIDKPLGTDSEELYSSRTPRNQVIDRIIEDLDSAIEHLPSGKQLGGTRLSKEIALLFKSRVALYEGTWQKYHTGVFNVSNPDPNKYLQLAVQAAEEVMKSGIYGIYSTGDPERDYSFFAEVDYSNNPEVLFWKKYDPALGVAHARGTQTAMGFSGGTGLVKSFVESYLTIDGKPIFLSDGSPNPLYQGDSDLLTTSTNRDPRFKQTIFTPGSILRISGSDTVYFTRPAIHEGAHLGNPTGYQFNKFLNYDPVHIRVGEAGVGYYGWIFYRYAEVLLNYAEAKAELGSLAQDDVDNTINLLRERVGMPHLDISNIETDPNWSFPNLSPVINEIRRERRIELVLEGFRWDDIARWAAANELIVGQRPLGAKFSKIDYPNLSPEGFNLTDGYLDPLLDQIPNGYGFNTGRDYLSPISTQELTLNPNLVQNPGW